MTEILEEERHHALEALKQFELSGYEAKAYITLLELGDAEASDVAEEAGIPTSRVYDILRSLEKKGMVTKQPTSPKVYTANHAQRALEHLVYRIEKSNEERVSFLRNKMSELTDALPSREAVSNRTDAVRVMDGTYSVACKLIEGMQDVEETMYVVGDSPFVRLKSRSSFDTQIGDRPVDIKALGVFDQDTITEMERHNAEVRETEDGIIQSYFLFDEERLLQVRSSEDGEPCGLMTEEYTLVETYLDRFKRQWAGHASGGPDM